MFNVVFQNSSLYVFDQTDRLILLQPFRPTNNGEQIAWQSESEALDWWETQKNQYLNVEKTVAESTPDLPPSDQVINP